MVKSKKSSASRKSFDITEALSLRFADTNDLKNNIVDFTAVDIAHALRVHCRFTSYKFALRCYFFTRKNRHLNRYFVSKYLYTEEKVIDMTKYV